MEWLVLCKGLILGMSIAAPVGPIGLLCIKRTLAYGCLCGVASGLGAATADALYGSIAAFGLTAIAGVLLDAQLVLRIGGGLFLIYLGCSTYRLGLAACSEPVIVSAPKAFVSTFLLTMTNPMTIMFFAGVFAGMGIGGKSVNFGTSALLVFGVWLGSMLWWLLLCTVVNALREQVGLERIGFINKLAGFVLAVLGVLALVSAV